MQLFEIAFVDMDGVLFDFITDALRLHKKLTPDMSQYPNGLDVEEYLGLHGTDELKAQFWRPIFDSGYNFWRNLKPLPWYREVIAAARSVAKDVKILSSPGSLQHPSVYYGKKLCLDDHGIYGEFLPFKSKYLVAGKGRLLIDDHPKHVDEFQRAGGHAILFPSLSNSDHPLTSSTMFHFGQRLHKLQLDVFGS